MEIPREYARDDTSGRRRTTYACLALIAAHAMLLASSAVSNSITFDEFAHLPAGCAYWKYQEFSIYNQSPPLLRLLGSWPAMLTNADVPDAAKFRKFAPKDRHWFYAVSFERANIAATVGLQSDSSKYHRLFVLGRLAMIPISCLGAWIVFLWARKLHGEPAGLAACALWSLNPDVLAHGSIVGTDLGAAVAMLLALWLWQRFLEKPSPNRTLSVALGVGVAHRCMFLDGLVWPWLLAVATVAL